MKKRIKWITWICTFSIFLSMFHVQVMAEKTQMADLRLLCTSDLHDNYKPLSTSKGERGGYSRLATAISEEKTDSTIFVDGGDYSMGSILQTIYKTKAPTLRFLGLMGCDATTLGNHEFDFYADGFAQSLRAAVGSGDPLPAIVAANMQVPDEGYFEPLRDAVSAYGVAKYTVIERNGYRVGIFGLMGENSVQSAPRAEVGFTDTVSCAKKTVEQLRSIEHVDCVVLLNHGGTEESTALAKKCSGIDVILSGHEHKEFAEPSLVNDTIIVAVGKYAQALGILDLVREENGKWNVLSYRLRKIDASIPESPEITVMLDKFTQDADADYFQRFGLSSQSLLAVSTIEFTPIDVFGSTHVEDPLGDLVADAYVFGVQEAEGASYRPVDVAVVTAGSIRASIGIGEITAEDAFNIRSVGVGLDGIGGEPLVTFYLTGQELKTLCEVDASLTSMQPAAQLYFSGLHFRYNESRLPFDKVTDLQLVSTAGKSSPDNQTLYRVATSLFNAQMLSELKGESFGLLQMVPKDEAGEPVKDLSQRVVSISSGGYSGELKEWYAIADYLSSFPATNGTAVVPDSYAAPEGRKIGYQDNSLAGVLGNPGRIGILMYCVGAVLVLLLTGLVLLLLRHRKRRAKYPLQKK